MYRILLALAVMLALAPRIATAQGTGVYVQIEAKPTMAEAQAAISQYETYLQDVNGFTLANGFYAIALGPYTREDAGQVLRVLRGEGRIPGDSYIASPSWYAGQFWPPAGDSPAPQAPAPAPEAQSPAPQAQAPAPQSDGFQSTLPEETVAEARAGEAQLDRGQRDQLQQALKAAGFYSGAIDGAFGRGTRNAMASWQAAQGYEATGVLTTSQRATLVRDYNAVLSGLDLRQVEDSRAGISVQMPTARVAFDRYDAPFAFYKATSGADTAAPRVILISQPGDRGALSALYEILQTLAIVPANGPRSRTANGFTITGRNSRIVSYTEASLEDGQIKGFTLVWPAGDDSRFDRLRAEMKASFRRLPDVLPAAAARADDGQSIDLVSGLQLRRPAQSRSGLFVDSSGAVLTVASAVAQCARITLDQDIPAQVVQSDPDTGLAVLRPDHAIAPRGVAAFASGEAPLGASIAVAGYSYQGVLGAPTLSFGKVAGLTGLDGESGIDRLAVRVQKGDAGGAVLDMSGRVLGILRAPAASPERKLPANVAFSLEADTVTGFLRDAGVTPKLSAPAPEIAPERLSRQARDMAVLVSCWN
ncbi:trypsin-like peptidase domain-containing protein [Pseudooceanicola sp. CBS1P-1]|uniref:Peptidoglycan-binding protein n=1 Tax=Pseudooceanicola albus TaxID=2692189 RepID=A0A6L7G695_9RHOB|nr:MULTISPECIES: serine protease [Pseudooceanicola]MBT9385570.1 trypsin-like peptidase domain-containing protein [Pseudooceanicola endophyticus]MXN19018.1 peptidoglycan-binding protein [Pseudooceanicola albus]